MPSDGAKDLFKKICAYYPKPVSIFFYSPFGYFVSQNPNDNKGWWLYITRVFNDCFNELLNEGYLLIEKEMEPKPYQEVYQIPYQITKEGYDFYNKELSEVK